MIRSVLRTLKWSTRGHTSRSATTSTRVFFPEGGPIPAKKWDFDGKITLVGFGSVGAGTLPLLRRHLAVDARDITIVTAEDCASKARSIAGDCNIKVIPLDEQNYETVLADMRPGDLCVNLSVDVSSCDMMRLCNQRDVLYVDTVIEPWKGFYHDPSVSNDRRSNYGLREGFLELREELGTDGPTAVTTMGANPGMVNLFVKQALLNIAKDNALDVQMPSSRLEWSRLAQALDIRTIHIAERDTQVSNTPKKVDEFLNTWSVDGFISEALQPAELGWGTHEKTLPENGHKYTYGTDAAIYLNRPGMMTKVRTWTPNEGPLHGFLIPHNESISLADYFCEKNENGIALYRPTVHYAYHPADCAILSLHEFAGRQYEEQSHKEVVVDDIVSGEDELGVLLMGNKLGPYWYGSQLEINEARRLCPHNNATSLQVAATVLAGALWAIENPRMGMVEPEEVDHAFCLDIINPYVAPVVGSYATDWTPIKDREAGAVKGLFPEGPKVDLEDPYQFTNVLVDY